MRIKTKKTYSALKGENSEYIASEDFYTNYENERSLMMTFALQVFNFLDVEELEYFISENEVLVLGLMGKAGQIIGQIVPNE